jgi:hypothetical protein
MLKNYRRRIKMKNRFSKKVFLSLLMVLVLGVFLSGCGATTTIIAPPTPTTCTLSVYSQCWDCWGYVWVNGLSTGVWISQNGAASVTGLTVGTTVSVAIHDQLGYVSHSEIKVLVSGTNIVIFDTWS